MDWVATVEASSLGDAISMKNPADNPASGAGVAHVFLRRRDALRRVLAGLGFGDVDAEDILQDVYVEATRGLREIRSEEQAVGWLVRVTINRGLLEYRKRQRFRVVASRAQQDAPRTADAHPDQAAIQAEEFEAVRQAMQDLDLDLLVALSLRYYSDMDSSQIAEVLGIPASTVRSRLRQARLILADKLSARGIEP